MAITLTTNAAEYIGKELTKNQALGFKITIKKTGCSGFGYAIDYAHEISPEYLSFESHGVKIFIDPLSLKLIDGTEIDLVTKGLSKNIVFKNPKAVGTCGCGESFSVEAE